MALLAQWQNGKKWPKAAVFCFCGIRRTITNVTHGAWIYQSDPVKQDNKFYDKEIIPSIFLEFFHPSMRKKQMSPFKITERVLFYALFGTL